MRVSPILAAVFAFAAVASAPHAQPYWDAPVRSAGDDTCRTAFNDVCDEPRIGTGRCAPRTDRRDCRGPRRPLDTEDHFYGHDDRVLLDPASAPWRSVGRLLTASGGHCTATLIGPNILLTAAHCVFADGQMAVGGATFTTAQGAAGGPFEARVTRWFMDPRFNIQRMETTDDIRGLDFALLEIDRDLGERVGFLDVGVAGRSGGRELLHAGYPRDVARRLVGHLGCRIRATYPDGVFAHDCDTTIGDSGSPLMMRSGGRYRVVGVDSNVEQNDHGPAMYIAVSAAAFERYIDDFAAGRIGRNAVPSAR